jgi:ABC transport system ATP-binding/permease protein
VIIEKKEEKKAELVEVKIQEANKRKPSFKEKFEFEQLEKEIAELESEKAVLTEKLNQTNDHEEITKCSKRISEIIAELDEKGVRWLELSELI